MRTSPEPSRAQRSTSPRGVTTAGLFVVALLALLLVGCVDTDQSAIAPGVADSGASIPDAAVSATPVVRPDVALTLNQAPEARRIYFLRGGDLWQLPVDNLAAPVVTGQDILAYSPAPDGERVVVVSQQQPAGGSGGEQIALVRADSTVELRVAAGSLPGDQQPIVSVAWAPHAKSVAVARADGGIEIVNADGTARELVPSGTPNPGDLAWSPDGRTLAWMAPISADKATGLFTVAVAGGQPRQVVAAADASTAVVAATWLPGRGTLAFVRRNAGVAGGDVFEVSDTGGGSSVLISAGQFAPVAGIVHLAASPDGRYLAATVFVPGSDRPQFQSLRLVDLTTNTVTEMPTAPGEVVTDVWFASGQLIFRAIDESHATATGTYTGTEPFGLYQVDLATLALHERYRR